MSRRLNYSLLAFLLSLVLLLRVPDQWLFQPTGSDANAYRFITILLLERGTMVWILDPSSYFGMYPYSYASGCMALNGSIVLVSGLKLEDTILVFSLLNALMGTLFAFMVGRLFFNNNLIPIVIALSFTLNHYFLIHTLWRFSTRGAFMALVPFFVWAMYYLVNEKNKVKGLILAFTAGFVLLSLHRMSVYVWITIAAPIILIVVLSWINKRLWKIDYKSFSLKNKYFPYFLQITLFLLLVTVIEFPQILREMGLPIRELWVHEIYNYPYIGKYLNVARSYFERGLFQFLTVVGVLYFLLKRNKNFNEHLVVGMLFFQILFILDLEYFMPVFSFMMSVMAGYGVVLFHKKMESRKQAFAFLTVAIIIIPISFAFFQRDVGTRVQIVRDGNPEVEGGEMDDASVWRSLNIPKDKMILGDSVHVMKLGFSGEMLFLEDNLIVWLWGNISDNLQVDRFSIFDVVFNQPGYFYGGNVSDWTTGEENIYGEKHERAILQKNTMRPSYDKLIEYYELNYVASYQEPGAVNPFQYPLIEEVNVLNYKVYDNEVFAIFFYDEW